MEILPHVIEATHVFLAPERRDNVPLYWKWANDREVTRLTKGYGRAPSLEAMEASYDKAVSLDDSRQFGVHLISTGDLIGRCALKNLNLIAGRGEASILIGDEKYRGHGYGTEAMRLLCIVGFDMLELHTIYLTVLACNPRAIASYRKLGFKDAGCLREASARDGKRIDILYMDLLREDLVRDAGSAT
ncbi:MAG: GNAT family protein [Candidatus Cryosericum sp.]|nr:GNAT family N-acetyltransferase [bacterium]